MTWFTICGVEHSALAQKIADRQEALISRGIVKASEVQYVSELSRVGEISLDKLSPEIIERIRRLAQLWDVEFKFSEIKSHRKYIGPFLVAGKKILARMIYALFRESFNKQRDFNAELLALLVKISK